MKVPFYNSKNEHWRVSISDVTEKKGNIFFGDTKKNMDGVRMRQLFARGDLAENSLMIELTGIGEYIFSRISRRFNIPTRVLTIKKFLEAIAHLNIKDVTRVLQKTFKNARANQCTDDGYHIRDVNKNAWKTVVSLLRFMSRRYVFAFDPRQLKYPRDLSVSAQKCSCIKTRRACNGAQGQQIGCKYVWGLCVPQQDARGFEGIGNLPGQRLSRALSPSRIRSLRRKGIRYNTNRAGGWRFPSN